MNKEELLEAIKQKPYGVKVGSNWIYHWMNFSFKNINLCHDYFFSWHFDIYKLIPCRSRT